jgi:hypothetical protein
MRQWILRNAKDPNEEPALSEVEGTSAFCFDVGRRSGSPLR